jgi:hypothetical protein
MTPQVAVEIGVRQCYIGGMSNDIDRLMKFVSPEPNSGCWLWTGAVHPLGYGGFYFRGKRWPAYRVSYTLLRGEIPAGLQLDHLCRTPACVNPDHLEPVTQGENQRRGVGFSGKNARKTHCPKGHPYDENNTLRHRTTGARKCRQCNTESCRKRFAWQGGIGRGTGRWHRA